MLENRKPDFDEQNTAWYKGPSKLGAMWCGFMHDSPMWPIHGQYQCRTCGRRRQVEWDTIGQLPVQEMLTATETMPTPTSQSAPLSFFRSALLPLIVTLALFSHSRIHAAEALTVDSNDRAAMAFARYTAGTAQSKPWPVETIVIDASLPKMEEKGRLRAIRRLSPVGKPEYQVLEIAGDQTVKQQVIFRYLSAEARASEVPASTVAITPANYKFRYNGVVTNAGTVAYSYVIKPRKKRVGLIKGELWLDGDTGAVVRQSGYLVKSPSIFVKRVTVITETALRDGVAEERVTHLSVDARLVGRAELTIHERPHADADNGAMAGVGGQ
jgi:hypothetical protein